MRAVSAPLQEHIVDRVSREDMRAYGEERIRELARELDVIGDFDPYRYVPPGPVAQSFILDRTPTAAIMGPLGAGKTTACVFKRIYFATLAPVARHPADGKPTRMCRGIVLRDTFRSVEKTVLESWKQWFAKGYPGSSWAGGNDRPVTHTLWFRGEDGIRIEAITEFAGLGEMSIETLMKGREYSFAWLNELDTHALGALDDMEQRVGRYPRADLILSADELAELERQLGRRIVSGPRLAQVIGDLNAPTIDNWTYPTLVTDRGPDRAFFQQPSGRSPEAENRFALEPDYYARIVANQDEAFVRRMVDNRFGYSRAGMAVHQGFRHELHVAASPIAFRPELPLLIGLDASTNALTPAAVLGQPHGVRLVLIDELWLGHGVGPARFGERLRAHLDEHYPDRGEVRLWADPASQYGGDTEGGQLAAMDIIARAIGVPVLIPFGGSNELGLRLGAVDAELRGHLEPNSALLISPRCPLTIEALAGRYRFRKRPGGEADDYEDAPEKSHPHSDIADAGQYLIGGYRGRAGVMRALGGEEGGQGRAGGWGRRGAGGGFNPHAVGAGGGRRR